MWNLNDVVTITDPHTKLIASQFVVAGIGEVFLIAIGMMVVGLIFGLVLRGVDRKRFATFLNAHRLQDKYEQWELSREKAAIHWGLIK